MAEQVVAGPPSRISLAAAMRWLFPDLPTPSIGKGLAGELLEVEPVTNDHGKREDLVNRGAVSGVEVDLDGAVHRPSRCL